MTKYKILDHTADIGIEVWGKTKKELFASAALAIFDLMIINGEAEKTEEKTIAVTGNDLQDLLVNFLREILYLFNGKSWLVKECRIKEMTAHRLVAQVAGERFNRRKHEIKKEIKAVTYHSLSVTKNVRGWKAKVIFDL
ncbi:MAG TPA: archease [Smithellaceae bacterium]|nr:archease [Smithellaceae bacterium]